MIDNTKTKVTKMPQIIYSCNDLTRYLGAGVGGGWAAIQATAHREVKCHLVSTLDGLCILHNTVWHVYVLPCDL